MPINKVRAVLVVSQLVQVLHTGRHVLTHSGEVHVCDVLRAAVLSHDRSNCGVVSVGDAGKQVMLNLIV